ncbi:MAG: glycosyltransferase family 2 protein, partial [Planctomycetota bacterium]
MKLSHPAETQPADAHDAIDVSIVVPMYNEEDSVVPLYREIAAVMDAKAYRYEAIFISDGSTDDTVANLREASKDDPRVTILELMRNFGQTAATAAGFDAARGAVIVPMDGDGQNDPADIPALVAMLDENGEKPGAWDIVSGWRKNRQDKLMSRRLPSIIANRLVKRLTWTTEIHDFGCSLKAYRRKVLEDVKIYGEMHRFLPAICKWRGARVTEEVVHHRAREFGKSKYGLKRTAKVLLDLLTVKFLGDYLAKPIY